MSSYPIVREQHMTKLAKLVEEQKNQRAFKIKKQHSELNS